MKGDHRLDLIIVIVLNIISIKSIKDLNMNIYKV